MSTPYVLLQSIWHKIDPQFVGTIPDSTRLVCGLIIHVDAGQQSDRPDQPRPTICPGCEKEFPATSIVSTSEINLRIWKTAIACAATEEKREEIMRFHKLAVAAARSLGAAEARLAYEQESLAALKSIPPEEK